MISIGFTRLKHNYYVIENKLTFQVKIWFQNRRMKWKRSKKAQQEAKHKPDSAPNEHKANSNSNGLSAHSMASHCEHKPSNSLNDCVSDKSSKIQISFTSSGSEQSAQPSQITNAELKSQSMVESGSRSPWPHPSWPQSATKATDCLNSIPTIPAITDQPVETDLFYRPYVN